MRLLCASNFKYDKTNRVARPRRLRLFRSIQLQAEYMFILWLTGELINTPDETGLNLVVVFVFSLCEPSSVNRILQEN